jgi:hypothetical protein
LGAAVKLDGGGLSVEGRRREIAGQSAEIPAKICCRDYDLSVSAEGEDVNTPSKNK